MVEVERLRALLDRLRDAEAELARLRDLGVPAVRDDVDRLNSAKYLFVLAGEVAIDAGQHVIASENLKIPSTFAGVFEELGRAGWLADDLVTAMAAVARFRNLLVHGYADVDDDRVVEILHSQLGDLARFRQAIAERLEAESGDA